MEYNFLYSKKKYSTNMLQNTALEYSFLYSKIPLEYNFLYCKVSTGHGNQGLKTYSARV